MKGNPPNEIITDMINLFSNGKFCELYTKAEKLIGKYPNSFQLWNILGVTNTVLGRPNEAIENFDVSIKNNPEYAPTHNNKGNAFRILAKPIEAVYSYSEAVKLKPTFSEAYHSMANCLQDLNELDEALKNYRIAIELKPDFAEAYRNMCLLKKYYKNDPEIFQMESLYHYQQINKSDRCHLCFALSKVCEDLGDFEKAFTFLKEGNALRKELLGYKITKDQELFSKIKKSSKGIKKCTLKYLDDSFTPIPIFILGMPRSGTTLVEQIISSHSQVKGAGELKFLDNNGRLLSIGKVTCTNKEIMNLRNNYLKSLQELSDGYPYVTDKMPHNFLNIHLICRAFPEAKIIHTKRQAFATCWSNFKTFFTSERIGYAYDLGDIIKYYRLYLDLMDFWNKSFKDRIYELDYDRLTVNQNVETKKLIAYIGVEWENACLRPEKNERIIQTASQRQVRQKVYKGSSDQWNKYKKFLNGAFDEL